MTTPTASVPAKKKGPLFWVLLGIGVFVLLIVAGVAGLGYFAYNAAQKLGITAELARDHPEYVVVKTTTAINPDNEILEEDIDGVRIHFRSKKSGEEYVNTVDANKQVVRLPYDPTKPFPPPKPPEQK